MSWDVHNKYRDLIERIIKVAGGDSPVSQPLPVYWTKQIKYNLTQHQIMVGITIDPEFWPNEIITAASLAQTDRENCFEVYIHNLWQQYYGSDPTMAYCGVFDAWTAPLSTWPPIAMLDLTAASYVVPSGWTGYRCGWDVIWGEGKRINGWSLPGVVLALAENS